MKKIKETPTVPGAGQVVEVAKKEKERFVRATFFPTDGSRPYTLDLVPDEEGMLDVEEAGMSYKVSRGSVWQEDGVMRTIINEDNPQTVSAQSFKGDDTMHPKVLHAVANNNFWTQLDEINRQKSPWRQSSTWITIVLAVIVILMLVWQVRTIGSGFEELRHAIDNIPTSGGGGGGDAAREAAGHQDIDPGGN